MFDPERSFEPKERIDEKLVLHQMGTGLGRESETPRVSLEYKNYHNGDLVTVLRSDGKKEVDWNFSHQNMETGDIIVVKTIDGKKKMKEISPDNFEKMQEK